jgi:hypothetical protein
MTTFNDEFAASAFPELVDQFGEETTYRKADGTTRTIDAIVVTNELALQAFAQDVPSSPVIVRTLTSTTRGILASEVVLGKDRIDVSRDGRTAVAATVQQILSDDGGVTSVLCF